MLPTRQRYASPIVINRWSLIGPMVVSELFKVVPSDVQDVPSGAHWVSLWPRGVLNE